MQCAMNSRWKGLLAGSLILAAVPCVRADQVFGNFETDLDGWTVAWDGTDDLGTSSTGATLDSRSMTVLVGDGDFWKLQRIGFLNLVGASRITMDITFIASEWPGDTWINVNKIALMDQTFWNWQEVDRDMMVVTKISGADPPGDDGSGNIAWWGPWMGDVTWAISWRLQNISKSNDTYQFYMALQCNKAKGSGGYFYIDNVRVVAEDLVPPPPRLHAQGNKIKNPAGEDVILRGVSLIDLGFLQSWQGGALAMIDRLTDPSDTRCNSVGWQTKVIRVPVFPPHLVEGWPYPFEPNDNDDLYDLLRMVVDYCGAKGLYVILDWHDINNTFDTLDAAVDFWNYMAPRFADDEHVMFELFNEPINQVGTDTENWLSVKADMETLISVVRSHAPDTLLLIGTPVYCQILGPVLDDPVNDDNVVYVTHLYPYHWIENHLYHTSAMTQVASVYPILLGEWGFIDDTSDNVLKGTITNYGEPLKQFAEGLGIGSIAWVSSYDWQPPMFDEDWNLLEGEGYMGCFAKDWLYSGWQSEQDLDLAMTINRCQVTAGKTSGQDTLEMSGTFESIPPNLLGVSYLGVTITSLRDSAVIYSENCDYKWDISGNRFLWSERYRKGEPGRITLLVLDFARRRFLLKAESVNLTGLGCPLELSITVGPYVLSGQAEEAIVNGTARIPIRLMRGYADELRVSRAVVKQDRKVNTDSLQVWGEIALEDVGQNLRSSEFVLRWGQQTFTIPAGTLRSNRSRTVYSCGNVATQEGAKVWLKIDTQKCLFSVTIARTELEFASGDGDFGIQFGDFDESVSVSMP